MRRPLAALSGCALAGLLAATPSSAESVASSDGRYAMGTVLEISLHGPDERANREALDALFALAARLDARMSVDDDASDVSRVNRSAGRGPQRVDPGVAQVVRRSLALSRLTAGAFDVTVRPLVELWTEAAQRGAPPDAEALARARERVGSHGVRTLADDRIELAAGFSIDLGGVAKGYALDRMRSLLAERGIGSALLNFGQSSAWAVGTPPGEPGWRLLARAPEEGYLGVLALKDQALSVSGSLGQWVEIGGLRYGHVLDPRTGRPLTRRRQALGGAPDATLAEALSKALLVLGEVEGRALVDGQPGCAGLLVDAEGGVWTTSRWTAATRWRALDRVEPATP